MKDMKDIEKPGSSDAPGVEASPAPAEKQVEFIDVADLTHSEPDVSENHTPTNELLTPPPPSDNARARDYYNKKEKSGSKRGRKRMSEEEKEQRRIERIERRKIEAAKADERLASRMTAATVVGGLDSIRDLISLNECTPNPELRASTLAAWERYCYETGKEIPASTMVIITSAIYVAPALHTAPAVGLFKSAARWIKSVKFKRHE